MKDPDLLGKPNYTVHSNNLIPTERTSFFVVKYSLILISMALWFFFVLRKGPSSEDGAIVITIDYMVNVLMLFIMPIVLAKGICIIGEATNNRYVISMEPVELRLYDDCAVKYTVGERFNTFVQVPYENIRQCTYTPSTNLISFTGRFICVSFFSEDKKHTKPIYREIDRVNFPIEPDQLSEIASQSPIEIIKKEAESETDDRT